jgi:hypothetical protein
MYIQPEGLIRGTHQFQAKHTNQFLFSVDEDPTVKLLCKSASRPSVTFSEIQIPHINKFRYEAGRPTYDPLNITLLDYIVPSTSQYVTAWLATQGEIFTGRMGYSAFYRRKATLELVDPVGAVIEKWDYFNCFILTANFGEVSWDNEQAMEITLSIRYDDVIQRF